jgi:hypothetical protein
MIKTPDRLIDRIIIHQRFIQLVSTSLNTRSILPVGETSVDAPVRPRRGGDHRRWRAVETVGGDEFQGGGKYCPALVDGIFFHVFD